ncbi:MAG: hypothetical protein EB828_00405 [Nitrosopumilus sp. D6]|nr:MAG: hypothetical protein EB828_00405 [Nitrosopumilus sp. D6]
MHVLKEHMQGLFENRLKRLEIDTNYPNTNILVWTVRNMENNEIRKKIKTTKDMFSECEIDQVKFSNDASDLKTAILTIYGILGTTFGIISTIITFGGF